MEVPWWALSPSPFTIAQYTLFTLYGMHHFTGSKPKRFKLALFTLARVVLVSDCLWLAACAARFLPEIPEGAGIILFSFLRNIVLYAFFYAATSSSGFNEKKPVTLWILNACFLASWFIIAQTPADTDWTYAITRGYPWSFIWSRFTVSHILGRVFVFAIYQRCLIDFTVR